MSVFCSNCYTTGIRFLFTQTQLRFTLLEPLSCIRNGNDHAEELSA